MTDDRHPPSEYRWARQVSAVLLIAVVVLVVVLDVIVEGYEVSPPVLVPLARAIEYPPRAATDTAVGRTPALGVHPALAPGWPFTGRSLGRSRGTAANPTSSQSRSTSEGRLPEPLVRINDLVKTYQTPAGPLGVLQGIDMEIGRGEFIALVGPSGGGKSTFLNMLTGIDRPTSGMVVVDGVDVSTTSERKLTRWRARNIGIVFQFFQLLPTLTVLENVMMPMDFARVHDRQERSAKALALLERFDVASQAHKTPDLLSGGQQQRVAIARALANDPVLLVGDEPTGNLDHMSAAVVFETFYELMDQGQTVVIVTHDREVVQDVPKVLRISDGLIGSTPLEAAAKRRTRERQAARLASL